jgi:polygalacturonase
VAINSGQNILFENGYCHGGHGLSIGSVGGRTNNIVKNVALTNTVMENSQQSVRIKTISGANGTVDSITYRNIEMKGGDNYGILVDQWCRWPANKRGVHNELRPSERLGNRE